MKKNGFTLIEVIAVVAIIAILAILAIATNIDTKNKATQRIYQEKINSIETSAILWGQDHPALFSLSNCTVGVTVYKPKNASVTSYTCYTLLTVQSLLDNKYIDPDNDTNQITDPRNKSVSLNNNKVIVYHYFNNYYAEYQK